ncbi:MAG: SRPBCC family protein [Rhodocyclaceae bacterium]|jgi:ribosome-associated toxin RatA of RatAB toxin-antitoxin module|nr:SRPBCC family protein [Rhodocyclaceae bacterium]MCA3135348.1 SRPBCC family protein [Rhodocyclaceae bacterium]MCA3146276.1 SRPBCC family protein [Rhodocyclaceae bacterium]MCE2897356.1 SRPBCC family protein [Betaproteobacteria bacterium]
MASPRRLLLLCALLVPVWSALAQEVSVVSRREGEAVIVEALTELAVTPEQAWGPLTDYDNLARFIPDMQQSRVIERTGQRVLVEQQGSAGLFFLRRSIEVRLDIEESPHAWITARAVSGSFREMQGRYDIEPVAGVVRLRYTGRFVPDFWVPAVIGNAAMRSAVTRQFAAMAREILRRAGREPAP